MVTQGTITEQKNQTQTNGHAHFERVWIQLKHDTMQRDKKNWFLNHHKMSLNVITLVKYGIKSMFYRIQRDKETKVSSQYQTYIWTNSA